MGSNIKQAASPVNPVSGAGLSAAQGEIPASVGRTTIRDENQPAAQARNDAAPSDGMEYGSIYDKDISHDLMAAAGLFGQIRRDGGSVADFLAQQDLERGRQSPVVEMLLRFMDENGTSAKKIRELISGYYEAVRALGNPNEGDMFGGKDIPTREQLLKGLIDGQTDTGREAQRGGAAAAGGFEQYGTRAGGTAAADLQPAEQSRNGAGDGSGVEAGKPSLGDSDGLYSQSAMKSPEANIRRGREAMNRVLTEKADVKRAMFRQDLGWVDFVWGDDGTTRPFNKKGEPVGKGIAHILEARQRKDGMAYGDVVRMLTDNIVETVARGTVANRWERHDGKSVSVQIDYDGYRAGLVKNKGSNAWMVTAFELYETGAEPAGSVDTDNATHTKPTLTRQDVGAVSNTEKNIPQNRAQDKSAYRAKLDEALGRLSDRVTLITDVEREIPASAERILTHRYDGAFDAATGRVYLFAENLTPERAAFVAWHELGHRGFARGEFRDYRAELRRLDRHGTISRLADRIQAQRPDGDPARDKRDIALEEAAVELYAAKRTGEWEALEERYGVMVPQMLRRRTDSILQNVWEKLRAFVSRVFGRDTGDAELVSLLEDLHRDVSADTAAAAQEAAELSGDALMSIYTDDAGKIQRALEKMSAAYPGELAISRDSSRASHSEYIELSDSDKDLHLKIRVSDHALPAHHKPSYDMFDVFPRKDREENARGEDAKYYTDGSWVEAVAFAGEMFGLKVPKYVQNILDKEAAKAAEEAREKAESARKAQALRAEHAERKEREAAEKNAAQLDAVRSDLPGYKSKLAYLEGLENPAYRRSGSRKSATLTLPDGTELSAADYYPGFGLMPATFDLLKQDLRRLIGEAEGAQDGMRFSLSEGADSALPRSKAESLDKLRAAEPVRISGREIEADADLKQYVRNALQYGKTLRGTYVNKDSGREIAFGRKGLQEVLHHDLSKPEHIQSVAAIPQIIENAVYIDTRPNEDVGKNPDITEYEYYLAGLNIGGTDYTVRAAVGVATTGDKYYDHKLTQIEKGNLLEMTSRLSNAEIPNASPFSKINDKRLLQILQEEAGESPDILFSQSMQTAEEVRAFAETGHLAGEDALYAQLGKALMLQEEARQALKERTLSFKDKVIEAAADENIAFVRWVEDLPEALADGLEKQLLEQSFRRAAGMRDAETENLTRQFIQPFNRQPGKMSRKVQAYGCIVTGR
ncbi:hypothetical protein V6667_08060 [Neisseria leonii]|uniref:LPD3 domain-containing protein n=1 Tax=Neisseria leonii TaxID=2995413 RepID=UPI0030CFBE17